MSNVCRPITRGQSTVVMNEIENAMKEAGVDPQQVTKRMLNKKIFRQMILDYLKENNQAQIISDKFDSTDKVITTIPSGRTYNVRKDKLVKLKADGGLFDYVDGDIESWFGDIHFTDSEAIAGKVQRFKNAMTHTAIIEEGKHLDIYEEYDIVQALLLANTLVKAGEIETRGSGVIIYLKNTYKGNRCRLYVYRDSDGTLLVGVDEVRPDGEWFAGSGAFFSN